MGNFLAEILSQYNWRRVVVISSNYLLYWDASKAIRQVFSESNITITYETTYNRFPPEAYITQSLTKAKLEGRSMYAKQLLVVTAIDIHVQWNLGIRDTQGTAKNCPEFPGRLMFQVHFYVMNRPRD